MPSVVTSQESQSRPSCARSRRWNGLPKRSRCSRLHHATRTARLRKSFIALNHDEYNSENFNAAGDRRRTGQGEVSTFEALEPSRCIHRCFPEPMHCLTISLLAVFPRTTAIIGQKASFGCSLIFFWEGALRRSKGRELSQSWAKSGYFRNKPGYLDCNDSISLCKSLFKSASVCRCFSIFSTE